MLEILDIFYFKNIFLFLLFLMTIFYFFIATYEDFKKKEVFNFINFSFLFIILVGIIIYSLLENSTEILIIGLLGLILGFLLGTLLFFLGVWGGGDAKFLIPFGAIFALLSINSNIMFSYSKGFINSSLFESIFFVLILEQFVLILSYILIFSLIVIWFYVTFKWIKLLLNFRQKLYLSILFSYISFFIAIGIFSLFPIIDGYFRVFFILFFILLLFILPISSFFLLSKIKTFSKITFKTFLKDNSSIEVYEFFPKNVGSNSLRNFKKLLYFSPNSLSFKDLNKEEFRHQNSFKVVELVSILPLFLVVLCVSVLLLIIDFKELSLIILLHFLEFLFISFLVGGVYVFLLVIFNSIRFYSLILNSISKFRKFLYVFLFFFILITYFYVISTPLAYTFLYQLVLIVAIIVLSICMYEITKIIEKKIFISKTNIKDITLGDWIVEDVVIDNKIIFKKEDFKLGVDEEQLKVLLLLFEEKKIKNLDVKSGIAFIPHLLAGFLILITIQIFLLIF
ncbi:MAG: prepilin peptidase [Candidatus Woesearchaeota archaeon]